TLKSPSYTKSVSWQHYPFLPDWWFSRYVYREK
ncbi:transposase, partial [Shigella flexneri]